MRLKTERKGQRGRVRIVRGGVSGYVGKGRWIGRIKSVVKRDVLGKTRWNSPRTFVLNALKSEEEKKRLRLRR